LIIYNELDPSLWIIETHELRGSLDRIWFLLIDGLSISEIRRIRS
jgi:hypothetical protein